nr:ENTH (VHS) domain containing protein [Hymenolepis microstoma]
MSDAEQILRIYRNSLDGLKENDKNKINKLTLLAKDHVQIPGFPQKVVEATVRHVYEIAAVYKLLGLYVIDSIVKNVDVPYRKLFTDPIVPLFVHSFQMIREEVTRKRLFNLRTTWKDIFPYPKMHSLDLAVQELDPAWPLIPKDDAPSEHRLPSVPKLPSAKVNNKQTPASSTSQPLNPVISESRDPRLCKKRKSPPESGSTVAGGQFLIDRDGNQKMEFIARKLGRFEEEVERQESKKAKALFSVKDQDMRSSSDSVSATVASRVSDVDKSKRLDVDMRLGGLPKPSTTSSSVSPRSQGFDTHLCSPSSNGIDVSTRLRPPSPSFDNIPRNNAPPTLPFNQPSMRPLNPMPGPPARSPHFHMLGPQMPPYRMSPDRMMPPEMPPQMLHHPNMSPSGFNRPPHRGPQISGPDWSVEIDGLNHMIQIGIDPRMLFRASNPKPERQITIDGYRYRLLLDRIQPLIQFGDNFYAVRFRCENMAFIIDHQRIVVPGTGFTRVRLLGRDRLVYLGGPGHELVIDGRPHTIPFNTKYSTINIDQQTVPVMYDCEFPNGLNVLPPIPRQILDWAYRGLFGSPNNLHLAPKNPLFELEKQMENRPTDAVAPGNRQYQQQPQKMPNPLRIEDAKPEIKAELVPPPTSIAHSVPPPSLPVSVDDLLSKLVASGVFKKPEVLPDIKDYSWEKFRRVYVAEIDALYSGFQCLQCGLRFASEDDPAFVAHLDYHYMKNSTENQGRRSRNYYQPASNWLSYGLMEDTSDPDTHEVKEYKCPAFADEKLNECAVCGDKFDKIFDRQEGEWMLLGAIIEDGKAYHPICREDAGKQFPVAVDTFTCQEVRMEENQNSLNVKAETAMTGSVSPAHQLSVSIKSEPDIIESKNGIETLNFSSSSGNLDVLDPQKPHLSEVGLGICEKSGEVIKEEPAKLSPETLPPPSNSFPFGGETEVVANLGIARNSPLVSIPGLSPTNSTEGGEENAGVESNVLGEDGGIGGGGQSAGSSDALVTPDTISSNPLAALEAVLGRKIVLP